MTVNKRKDGKEREKASKKEKEERVLIQFRESTHFKEESKRQQET